ncbi:hypothetical protein PIB30_079301, partial [Stylosanthes scabra]|nr:hypothetical protein [Stylosanthes scabra]
MSTADPRLDELLPNGNKPPQGGEVNPYPNVLGIHNSRGPRSQQNSSKSRVTRKNSPAQIWPLMRTHRPFRCVRIWS